jgi:hypothetical protein
LLGIAAVIHICGFKALFVVEVKDRRQDVRQGADARRFDEPRLETLVAFGLPNFVGDVADVNPIQDGLWREHAFDLGLQRTVARFVLAAQQGRRTNQVGQVIGFIVLVIHQFGPHRDTELSTLAYGA